MNIVQKYEVHMKSLFTFPLAGLILAGCVSPSGQQSVTDSQGASQQSSDAVAPAVAVVLATPAAASGAALSVSGAASTASGNAALDTASDILFTQPVPTVRADPAPRLN